MENKTNQTTRNAARPRAKQDLPTNLSVRAASPQDGVQGVLILRRDTHPAVDIRLNVTHAGLPDLFGYVEAEVDESSRNAAAEPISFTITAGREGRYSNEIRNAASREEGKVFDSESAATLAIVRILRDELDDWESEIGKLRDQLSRIEAAVNENKTDA